MGISMHMLVQRLGDDGRWVDVPDIESGVSGPGSPVARDWGAYSFLVGDIRGGDKSGGAIGGRGWPEDSGDMERVWLFVGDMGWRTWATLGELARLPWVESGLSGSLMARWVRKASEEGVGRMYGCERVRVLMGFE